MYSDYAKTLDALLKLSDKNGGTEWLTDEQDTGYIVGSWGIVLPDDNVVPMSYLARVIQAKIDSSWSNGEFFHTLGVWRNEGKVYIDLGLCFQDKDAALVLAKANNELAIWDIENNTEIEVMN